MERRYVLHFTSVDGKQIDLASDKLDDVIEMLNKFNHEGSSWTVIEEINITRFVEEIYVAQLCAPPPPRKPDDDVPS